MGLVDDIKAQAKKAGTNKGKFLYFKEGAKIRVRFLQDMEDGEKVTMHDSFAQKVEVPCQLIFDKRCPYCDDDDMRTRDKYGYSVWDHESKEVKILFFPVNSCSPLPNLVSMYETYGTIMDRDYVIQKMGSQTNTTFSVVPMDKTPFKNKDAKPFSHSKFLSLLDKAYPSDESDDDDEPKKKAKTKSKKKDEDAEWNEDMSAKELYEVCEDRGIDVLKKKSAEYYIERLKDADGTDTWDEEEAEENDYESMSPKELFNLCKERDIDAKTKKSAEYYIDLLEENDAEEDEEDEDDWS